MIELNLKKCFRKNLKKLDLKKRQKVKMVLKIFVVEPYHHSLRRHKLKGTMKGKESLDVAGDLRIIIEPKTGEVIDVVDVGSHGNLYE